MRSGKTQDHSEPIIGNTSLAMNVQNPSLNNGAGLDVSPAVRDYLGLKQTDVTDWRFVDFREVPRGPWSILGENDTFVINGRKEGVKLTERSGRKRSRRDCSIIVGHPVYESSFTIFCGLSR
jgi:hypothetical protein